MVSHELRMPLTSVLGAATALQNAATDLDPAEVRQFHRIIVDRAEHMRHLIGDLLDVARIQTGALPVDPEPSELRLLVDEARSRFVTGGAAQGRRIRPLSANFTLSGHISPGFIKSRS